MPNETLPLVSPLNGTTYPLTIRRINFVENVNLLGYSTGFIVAQANTTITLHDNGQAHVTIDKATAIVSPMHWKTCELNQDMPAYRDTSNINAESVIPPPKHYDSNRNIIEVPTQPTHQRRQKGRH